MALRSTFPNDPAPIAAALDRDGFVRIEDAVTPEWLEAARERVRRQLAVHGDRFFSIVRPADEAGSPAAELIAEPRLRHLFAGLVAQSAASADSGDDDIYSVLRVVAGPRGDSGSLQFHYDASTVTALVPLFMPDGAAGTAGELVVFPNHRPLRRFVASNLLEKLLVQNRLTRRRTVAAIGTDGGEHRRILRPGDLYLFWGYRTYHGNLPCAPGMLRATMLLHYGNPHGRSIALRAIRSARAAVERLRRRG